MAELWSEREAATLLGMSVRTLQRLNRDGAGPPKLQISVRRVAYRHADLLFWIGQLQPVNNAQRITA